MIAIRTPDQRLRIGEVEVDQLRVRRLQVLERDDGS